MIVSGVNSSVDRGVNGQSANAKILGVQESFGFGRRLSRFRYGISALRMRMRLPKTTKLLQSPQEINKGDASIAHDIYAGHLILAGKVVFLQGKSLFESIAQLEENGAMEAQRAGLHALDRQASDANADFLEAFYGFSWLLHFEASENPLIRGHAVALIEEWLASKSRKSHYANRAKTLARRMQSLLAYASLLLQNADYQLYHNFMGALLEDASKLAFYARFQRCGTSRLYAALAFCHFTTATDVAQIYNVKAMRYVYRALQEQILPDGVHISRNLDVNLEVLRLLLPLRDSLKARGFEVPNFINSYIERLQIALKTLRFPDGSGIGFQGAGYIRREERAAIMAYHDVLPEFPALASIGGYHRLFNGSEMLVLDCGAPAAIPYAQHTCAAPLALEFADRWGVILGGALGEGELNIGYDGWLAARRAAAYSTFSAPLLGTRDELVSGRFLKQYAVDGTLELNLKAAFAAPELLSRSESETHCRLLVKQEWPEFALQHQRQIELSKGQSLLKGRDQILALPGKQRGKKVGKLAGQLSNTRHKDANHLPQDGQEGQERQESFALHFHFHGTVKALAPEKEISGTALALEIERSSADAGKSHGVDYGTANGADSRAETSVFLFEISRASGDRWLFRIKSAFGTLKPRFAQGAGEDAHQPRANLRGRIKQDVQEIIVPVIDLCEIDWSLEKQA